MSKRVPRATRKAVRQRANGRCEYCLLHEDNAEFSHEVEHLVARKHLGADDLHNLAWACFNCNRLKGSDLSSVDPDTGRVVRLFNPRRQRWTKHFHLEGNRITPLTPQGRATEYLLQFNRPDILEIRRDLIRPGRYP